MKVTAIGNNVSNKQCFGSVYRLDSKKPVDMVVINVLKNSSPKDLGGGTLLSQTLAWCNPKIREMFSDGVDLFMQRGEVSKYKDAYWLDYKNLPDFIKNYAKEAKEISKETAKDVAPVLIGLF